MAGSSDPIVVQPGAVSSGSLNSGELNWMLSPGGHPNCPPGLEFLATTDRILTQPSSGRLESFPGWEPCNKYRVLNSMGHQCYFGFEESDYCQRQCRCGNCGGCSMRKFTMHFVDKANREVIRAHSPFKCSHFGFFGCCNCCLPEMQVEAPLGNPIGSAIVNYYKLSPSYTVMDHRRQPIFTIQGPNCVFPRCPCKANNFQVLNYDTKQQVGLITKQWSDYAQGSAESDNFGISFPLDLDVHMKATLLGSLFLVDFMYFSMFCTCLDKRRRH